MKYAFDFSPYRNIAIFPHQNPDGDAIGSAVAMALYMKALGKKAVIVVDEDLQYELRFLCAYTEFIRYEEALEQAKDWDFCITVDCGDFHRLHRRSALAEGKTLLNIDHHVTNPMFGDFNIVDVKAPATCEIVYHMMVENGFQVTKEIGEAIYTGISTDTGNFLYDNVRTETFWVAAKLLELGIDKSKIVFELYQNNRGEKVKLFAEAMKRIRFYREGRLAITDVDPELLERTGASLLDTEGICESLRDIAGVEVACFMKEQKNDEGALFTKVSLRSLKMHDVSLVASKYGGGGHRAAAGFTVNKTKDEVNEILLEEFQI